jgi:DNA-binding transcriptional ArsR family regulator
MESGAKGGENPASAAQRLAQALEHPLRKQMFAKLSERSMSPAELATALDEPLSRVAYHYGVLEQAGGLAMSGDMEDGS